MRLARFRRKAFPEESLSVFFAVIRKKKVRVNGVVGKANQMLVEGDVVNIYENFKSVSEDDKKEGKAFPSLPPPKRLPLPLRAGTPRNAPIQKTQRVSPRTSPLGAATSQEPKSRLTGALMSSTSSCKPKIT